MPHIVIWGCENSQTLTRQILYYRNKMRVPVIVLHDLDTVILITYIIKAVSVISEVKFLLFPTIHRAPFIQNKAGKVAIDALIKIALFDSDSVYAGRFLEYFNHKKEFGHDLRVFTKKEKLEEYLLSNRIEILLLGSQEALSEGLQEKVRYCCRLTESREEGIYKYQSAQGIMNQLLGGYFQRQENALGEEGERSAIIYTVFSPEASAWDKLFAWSMAFQLSRQKKVLFFPLELLPVVNFSFLERRREGLSEFIYYLKGNPNYMLKMKELLNYGGGIFYLTEASHGFDLQSLSRDDIQRWMEGLRKSMEYQAVIFYLGYYHESGIELMKRSDRSYILNDVSAAGPGESGRLHEWGRQLECIGTDPCQDSFRYVLRPPDYRKPDYEEIQYRSLQELSGCSAWQQAAEQLGPGGGHR